MFNLTQVWETPIRIACTERMAVRFDMRSTSSANGKICCTSGLPVVHGVGVRAQRGRCSALGFPAIRGYKERHPVQQPHTERTWQVLGFGITPQSNFLSANVRAAKAQSATKAQCKAARHSRILIQLRRAKLTDLLPD